MRSECQFKDGEMVGKVLEETFKPYKLLIKRPEDFKHASSVANRRFIDL